MDEHTKTVNHLTVTTSGLRECLEKVVEASGWREKRGTLPPGRGIGIAASSYISGAGLPIYWNDMPHSGVMLKIDRGGGVAVFCGSTDIGQGSDSVLAYVVAEVLGVRPEDIRVVTADTDLTPVDLGSYSSRVTLMTGNAAKEAAEKLRGLLLDAAAKKLDVSPADLDARDRRIFVKADPGRGLAFDEAARLAEAAHGTLVSAGSYTPPKRAAKFKGAGVGPTPAYSYTACVVELDVDPATGEIRIDRVWVAHDGGTAINPLLVEGQVEGSIYMGIGEALMEEQVFRPHGLHKIPSMLEYKSPTTLETPEIRTILVQTHDPEGPYGAKEAGQGPLLPVIPAIANAVYDAVGVRIDEVPITPEKILKALDAKAKGRPARVGPERLPEVPFPEPLRVPPPWVDPEGARGRGGPPGRPGPAMMRLPPFTYLAPRRVDEAVRLLAEHGADAMVVAGGTDLYPNMKRRQFEPKVLVGLRGIRELAGIGGSPREGLRIGAATTLTRVAAHPDVATHYPALARAAGVVSTPQLRNAGTLGGNVCVDTRCNYYNQSFEWRKSIGFCMKKDGDICLVAPSSSRCWAVSSSDTAPVLWAMGAELTLVGPEGRAAHPGRGALPGRRDRVPHAGARRDRDRDRAAAGGRLAGDVLEAAASRRLRLSRPRGGGRRAARGRRLPGGAHRPGRGRLDAPRGARGRQRARRRAADARGDRPGGRAGRGPGQAARQHRPGLPLPEEDDARVRRPRPARAGRAAPGRRPARRHVSGRDIEERR